MRTSHGVALASIGLMIPLGYALLRKSGGDASTTPSDKSVKEVRSSAPPIPGKVVPTGPGIMYMGLDDSDHVNWVRSYLDKAAASDPTRARGVLAFRSLQGREGTSASLNTYDNMVITLGTGFGGLGLLPAVLAKLAGTKSAQRLSEAGFRYLGNREYEVATDDGAVTKGKGAALKVARASRGLMNVFVDVARSPETREEWLNAQLNTFLDNGGNIKDASQIATQALFNYIAHLQHWAPGFANGALAAAAKQVPGAPSAGRDVELAAKAIEIFYQKARAAGGWIPDWKQAKLYWTHMVTDGLGEAAGHPYRTAAEPPGVAAAGAWGAEAAADSIFKLVNALSEGHGQMLKAMTNEAKERGKTESMSKLLSWALHTYGPESLRSEVAEAPSALAFIAPPFAAIGMRGWAQWWIELQNFIQEYSDAYIGQASETLWNRAQGFRQQFNAYADSFRKNGIDVPTTEGTQPLADIPEFSLANRVPTAGELNESAKSYIPGGLVTPLLIVGGVGTAVILGRALVGAAADRVTAAVMHQEQRG